MRYSQERLDNMAIQRILKRVAGYEGEIDGYKGPLMRAALQRYTNMNYGNDPTLEQGQPDPARAPQVAPPGRLSGAIATNEVLPASGDQGNQVARRGRGLAPNA